MEPLNLDGIRRFISASLLRILDWTDLSDLMRPRLLVILNPNRNLTTSNVEQRRPSKKELLVK